MTQNHFNNATEALITKYGLQEDTFYVLGMIFALQISV